MEYLFNKHILFFVGTILFSFFINNILLKFVKTLGVRTQGEPLVRWSEETKPSIGGLTFYIIFLLSITLHPFIFSYHNEVINFKTTGIIGAVSLGFLMGLADDAYNTRPLLKFSTQLLCALILIYSGTSIQLFDSSILNYLLTVLWIAGLMNSINMLDNMDGITGSVSLVIALFLFFMMLTGNNTQNLEFTIVIGLIGMLFVFIYFNWTPAKMYMGDTGSQFLGVLLAALSINYLWNPLSASEFSISRQFLIPLLVFIIPITDTTTVFIKRMRKGNSPFIGGKDHTTHHLSYLGFSEKQVALLMILISLVSSVFALIIATKIEHWNHWFTLLFSGYFLLVFTTLFVVAIKNETK